MCMYVYVSKFGGCKRQDSPAKRNPVQTGNATTTTTTTTTTTNNNNDDNNNEMGDARGRVKVVANPGFGDRLRVSCVRPSVARGARSMSPCLARDR